MAKRIGKYALAIFMALQIGAGVIWVFCNWWHVPQIKQTMEYLEAAQTLSPDEYMGILYPLFLKVFVIFEDMIGLPYQMPVYQLQLSAAVWAIYHLLQEMGYCEKKSRYFTVFLMSVPQLLLYHMTVLPGSFVFSASVIMVSITVRMWKRREAGGKDILFLCGLWIITALLNPDYLFISGFFVIVFFLALWFRQYRAGKEARGPEGASCLRQLLQMLALSLAAIAVIFGVNQVTQTPGGFGKMQRTAQAFAFQRFVGQNFANTYVFWPEEVKEAISLEEAYDMAKRSDNLIYLTGPALEQALGKEKANQAYLYMAEECFRVRTKETLLRIRDDFLDYLFCPISLIFGGGNGHISASGWNYGLLTEHAPLLAKWYYWGSLYGFLFTAAAGLLCFLPRLLQKIKHGQRERAASGNSKAIGWLALYALLQAVWYTAGSGDPVNYGNVLPVIFCWYVFWCMGMDAVKRKGEQ